MITLLTAWINAHYESDFDLLFFGTFIIDLCIIVFAGELVL